MTLEKIHEITSALKRGAEVKIKIRGSHNSWVNLSLKDDNISYKGISFFDILDDNIAICITEPKESRLPTYEEVFKWFEEGKTFKNISTKTFYKITLLREKNKEQPILIFGMDYSIQDFIKYFTDKDGNSLMIIDK